MLDIEKTFIVVWGVFFPVWINTHEGVRQVDRGFIEAGQNLGYTTLQMYTRVYLPATAGYICAGTRQAIAIAYVMVFIAEWLGANRGVGYQLSVAHVVGATDHMLVGLVVLGTLAFLTDAGFRIVVRIALPWLEESSG